MKSLPLVAAAVSALVMSAGCVTGPCDHVALEYRVDRVEFRHDPPTGLQDYLNEVARDGWRLVQFVEHDDWYRVVVSRPRR